MWMAILKFFGGVWGKVAIYAGIAGALFIALGTVVLGIKKAGRNEQILIDQHETIIQQEGLNERVKDSIAAESKLRDDVASGGLRVDDGYKRKSKPAGSN